MKAATWLIDLRHYSFCLNFNLQFKTAFPSHELHAQISTEQIIIIDLLVGLQISDILPSTTGPLHRAVTVSKGSVIPDAIVKPTGADLSHKTESRVGLILCSGCKQCVLRISACRWRKISYPPPYSWPSLSCCHWLRHLPYLVTHSFPHPLTQLSVMSCRVATKLLGKASVPREQVMRLLGPGCNYYLLHLLCLVSLVGPPPLPLLTVPLQVTYPCAPQGVPGGVRND